MAEQAEKGIKARVFFPHENYTRGICGYLSQSELPVTAGLGTAGKVESVENVWPSGTKQTLIPPIDRLTVVMEGC